MTDDKIELETNIKPSEGLISNPFGPLDHLEQRIKRVEEYTLSSSKTQAGINKGYLEELRFIHHDIKKLQMDIERLRRGMDVLKKDLDEDEIAAELDNPNDLLDRMQPE